MESLGPDDISTLIIKHLNKEILPDEQRMLDEWVLSDESRQTMLQQLQEPTHVNGMLALLKDVDPEKSWSNFWSSTHPEETPVGIIRHPLFWKWTMAAVAACLLLVLGKTVLKSPPATEKPQAAAPKLIGPGRNTAILVLGNGQQILLDSQTNGKVASLGHGTIQKQGGKLIYQGTDAAVWNLLSTPRAGQFEVQLPDGTHVWLNNASSLRYPTAFTGATRSVTLTGEAYFDVAKDDVHPFKVTANDLTIQVLGTGFNIMSYSDETVTRATLVEGKIRVQRKNQSVVLRKGEQLAANSAGGWQVLPTVNTEEITDWKNGLFHFDNADLPTVMRQLARWYDVEVAFQGEFATKRIQGAMHRDLRLDQVLELLTDKDVHFTIQDRKIIVSH